MYIYQQLKWLFNWKSKIKKQDDCNIILNMDNFAIIFLLDKLYLKCVYIPHYPIIFILGFFLINWKFHTLDLHVKPAGCNKNMDHIVVEIVVVYCWWASCIYGGEPSQLIKQLLSSFIDIFCTMILLRCFLEWCLVA